jgi:hypothetical protein
MRPDLRHVQRDSNVTCPVASTQRVTPINIDQSIEYLTTLCLQQSRASDHCANQMFQFSHTIEVECFAMSLAIRVFAPALLSVLRQLHL